ncbi:MAG TPA: hypothetical protein VMH87_03985 [Pseudomonadales bacterium]|nr:hypothetical protein [Pseudomonadales bacterium]
MNDSKPLLTVTHTITESDCELIRQDMGRRMQGRLSDITRQQRAKARGPFRVLLWILGVVLVVIGIGLMPDDKVTGVFSLVIGGLIIGSRLALRVIARLTVGAALRTYQRSMGRKIKWDFGEKGFTISDQQRHSWEAYHSFDLADAGLVLLDKNGVPSWYIPASAVPDAAIRAQLAEILNKHFKPAAIPPPLPTLKG